MTSATNDLAAVVQCWTGFWESQMDPSSQIESQLLQSRLFGGLSPAVRRAVAARVVPENFEAGRVIFSRGDVGRDLYLVVEGRVRLSIVSLDGRELAFDHSTPGTVFGEIAVLDGSSRSATATALTRCRTMRLTRSALLELMAQHHEIAMTTIAFLCARLRDATDQLEDIGLLSVDVRLSRYLMRLLEATYGLGHSKPQRLHLNVSQTELGFLLGASRQKVNAALAALEAQGAICRRGDALDCVPDLLAEIAQG